MQEDLTKILDHMPSGDNGNGNGETMARSLVLRLGIQSNSRIRGHPSFEPILDSEEAATLLKIHPKTLQRLARNGKIPWIAHRQAVGFPSIGTERALTRVTVRTRCHAF
jgi:hypothetical protein